MAITIDDIAKEANVTKNSVSVALRGKKGVSEKTRKRIFDVAKNLGYTPNLAARSLTNGKSGLIGLIVSNGIDYIVQRKITEIEKKLLEKGYHLILSVAYGLSDKKKYIEAFRSRSVEALIVFGGGGTMSEDLYSGCSFPVIGIDCESESPNVNVVRVDREQGIVEATNHLLDLGHKDIALVIIKPGGKSVSQRISGIQKTFRERDLIYDSSNIVYSDGITQEDFYKAAYNFLKEKTPTAIIGQNDLFCLGIRAAIYKLGFRIPEDISLIGHDDFDFAPYFSPALTTISQPVTQIANTVTSMIVDVLENGPKESCQEIILKGKLIVRQSTSSR